MAGQSNNVAYIRPELARLFPEYYQIRDCLGGEFAIKAMTFKYLPMPNAADTSPANKAAYKSYLLRAVFFNATRRTLNGLIGQVFMRDPVVVLPDALAPLIEDCTGKGTTLVQSAKKSLGFTLGYSRSGLFVDFPRTGGTASKEDVDTGKVRATINSYSPMEIINWRTIEDGAKEKLSLVVLAEGWNSSDDGFEMKTSCQFRVLRLDQAGNYIQEIWRELHPTSYDGSKVPRGSFKMHESISMLGADGAPLKEILFMFIGSENNDAAPDRPNLSDLASVNIAHYRNSADYEQSCYIMGQPTIVVSGLTKEWAEDVLKGTINFGATGGIMLPKDAKADIIQASENTMIKEAMDHKERMMTSLGAKLVEVKAVQRTATETKIEATSEGSVLSSSAKNVSAAYLWALKWAVKLGGLADDKVEFMLNTRFDIAAMSPEEQKAVIEAWTKGATTFKEMRDELRNSGRNLDDDDKAQAEIEKEQVAAMAIAQPNVPGESAFKPTKPKAAK